ncbi:MAG TPA: cytochrome b/b6 domain-containing protein [Flavobacteriaceae bacterium]|nr:cytochrome b/b6 domain-containing protein [Flavobacteriaceae bacterium]
MTIKQKFTALHRVLHWIMAITMPILFITGFLRMYWMGKQAVADAIASQGIEVTKEQAKAVYKVLREPMWEWHFIFAHVMIFAFLARIIYMLVKGIRFPNPFKNNQSLKTRLQGFTYFYFYFFVFISAITGIFLEKGFFPDWKENIETVHKLGVYWFPIFILLHFSGILIAELSNNKGITSKMISGD